MAQLIIKRDDEFLVACAGGGKFSPEFPDAKIFENRTDARFVAESLFHLQGGHVRLLEAVRYGYTDQCVIWDSETDV